MLHTHTDTYGCALYYIQRRSILNEWYVCVYTYLCYMWYTHMYVLFLVGTVLSKKNCSIHCIECFEQIQHAIFCSKYFDIVFWAMGFSSKQLTLYLNYISSVVFWAKKSMPRRVCGTYTCGYTYIYGYTYIHKRYICTEYIYMYDVVNVICVLMNIYIYVCMYMCNTYICVHILHIYLYRYIYV